MEVVDDLMTNLKTPSIEVDLTHLTHRLNKNANKHGFQYLPFVNPNEAIHLGAIMSSIVTQCNSVKNADQVRWHSIYSTSY